ncbi:MAG: phage tail tape measure protein [Rhizobiales bacterium]|mgnify:CR=1 FL=1|nr:phage tail tape measure protein [Hyphomicrobiales bacterium]
MATLESRLKISLLDEVTSPIRHISGAIASFQRQQTQFMAPFRGMVGQVLALGAGYLGVTHGVDSTVGAAMRFESAFADVKKVVDGTDQQLDFIRQTIKQMSTEMPIASEDMAALFASAAESGVATNDLKEFAEMAARVGIAFDMSAGDAGESLAKLKTQLGLTVAETGDMADAINHLSNSMASKAKDVTDFMLRVGSLAEMGGLTKEQVAAMGSAMIAAGAQAETAGTAMQNVIKAMTKGDSAKKSQREVAATLGLDLPTLAKQMQKDAPGAIKSVLKAIAKMPKDRHIALISDFFGDEAKAFAPLIGNLGLLDQALDSVSDKAKFGGSAFREYTARANTTANVLQLLRNRFNNIFETFGESFLPTIRNAALGVNDILDTLGERATIFDKMSKAFQGFMQGFAPDSDIRSFINDLGDLLLGAADGSKSADALGRIFANFENWGREFRGFADAIANNPIAQFLASMAPYGLEIMLWGAGIAFLAGTIRSLAAALMLLSGASTIIGALKTVGSIADIVSGGTIPKPGGKPSVPVGGPSASEVGMFGTMMTWLKGFSVAAAPGAMSEMMQFTPGDTLEEQVANQKQFREGLERLLGFNKDDILSLFGASAPPSVSAQQALDNARGARQMGIGGSTTETLPGKTADDLGITRPMMLDGASIEAIRQPSGVQDVMIKNPAPNPNININLGGIHVTGATDPEKLANQVSSSISRRLREEMAGLHADMSYGVA